MSADDAQTRRGSLFQPHTLELLSRMRKTLQFIVLALFVGPVVFLAVVLLMHDGPWSVLGQDTQWVHLSMTAILIPVALVAPGLVRRQFADQRETMAKLLKGEPIHDEAVMAAGRYFYGTLVGCAILDGGAFLNLRAAMSSGDLIHVVVAGVLMLGILCWFPTAPRYLGALQRAVENAQLDEQLKE